MSTVRFGSYVERKDRKAGSLGNYLPLLSVSQYRGVLRFSELHDKAPRAEDFSIYKIAEPNDIVFNKMSIRSGALGVAAQRGVVTYHYEVLEPTKGTVPGFVSYLMKSAWFTGELIKRERGIGAGGVLGVRTTEVPFTVLRTVPVPNFSTRAQARITDYLDHETAEIDAFITELSILDDLLEERSSAIVDNTFLSHASHWAPLKRFGIAKTSGYSANASAQPAGIGEFGVLKTGAVSQGSLNPLENKLVDDPIEVKKLRARVLSGTLIVNRANTPALVGRAAYVDRDYPDLFLSDLLWSLNFKSLDPEFMYFYTMSKKYREAIEVGSVGASSTMKKIRFEDFARLEVPMLSIQDQKAVANNLRDSLDVLLETQHDIKGAVILARERRAALISAAVTGQIDVTMRHRPVAEVLEDEVREMV